MFNSVQYLSVYCKLTSYHVIECTPKCSELSVQYRTHRCKQKLRRMLKCCRPDTKESMICIDNKYGLIEITNFYQINHNFCTFPQKHIMQGRIQEFQNGGGGSRRGRIVCFDDPSHKPYVFYRRVVLYTYCKHCILTKINVFAYIR